MRIATTLQFQSIEVEAEKEKKITKSDAQTRWLLNEILGMQSPLPFLASSGAIPVRVPSVVPISHAHRITYFELNKRSELWAAMAT